MSGTAGDKATYSAPSGPPPSYGNQQPIVHHDAGPYNPTMSPPPPSDQGAMTPYNDPRAPDPAYNHGYASPPPQGYYANPSPGPGQWQQGPYQQGPYGPGPGPNQYQQQGGPMMYQAHPPGMMYGPPAGYYQDSRSRGGAGEGICAGILGALACCCCLDLMF